MSNGYIVRVWVKGTPSKGGIFNGTAFFINSNTLLTAKHVVEGYEKIYLSEVQSGGTLTIEAEDIQLCEKRDIAILKTKRSYNIDGVTLSNNITEKCQVDIHGYHDEESTVNHTSTPPHLPTH